MDATLARADHPAALLPQLAPDERTCRPCCHGRAEQGRHSEPDSRKCALPLSLQGHRPRSLP
ncbi:hypothetical protein VFPFJ_04323 [Purpureocillium lilacinum]|uniref:Uncharacterized protein n=1 Tax=Purpureocillium lilacinum TaxID=33203 RepID=A0A179H1J0_PURLI|nr:hypothetical protein VFPFJ_04323 [Purpureocillium lilacinum]OAQ83383.1 hypothetical protein VFPBJ_02151 [Purpureocillium lilacinum]OAQ90164.1 hypothetical protein VFPFJ_04323 [Purpureocillium lilacinum]